MESVLIPRITSEPDKCGGRPCIRGMRIRVSDIISLLAAGASHEEILADFPALEEDDIRAALGYAALTVDQPVQGRA
ncbi:DUF433 domain-containing protein [Massilia agilis]|uniref:DUF433 domain-containing protein n=1 Tax=Massilia agilis TaxID=1811226 RepID=A0ABT2DD79_9BURK|nr:DUF433 domain-containing protein [Massilia agilis]MCS0809281.1 DUF433 domain-containing protein [Massilia agilis]